MRITVKLKTLFLLLLIASLNPEGLAQDIPEPMDPPRMVNDFANLLDENQVKLLEEKLRAYRDSSTVEIAVVSVTSLAGYEIEDFATKLFGKWGIGNKEKDNGILILIAPNERKLRIEVGYGLEGTIPDLFAKQVVVTTLLPEIKENDFYKGIDKSVNILKAKIAGENISFSVEENQAISAKSNDNFWTRWGGWIIIAVIFYFVGPFRSRRSGSSTYSSSDVSFGSSSWSSDSSSDFGGFSGGDSGGGGASGSW